MIEHRWHSALGAKSGYFVLARSKDLSASCGYAASQEREGFRASRRENRSIPAENVARWKDALDDLVLRVGDRAAGFDGTNGLISLDNGRVVLGYRVMIPEGWQKLEELMGNISEHCFPKPTGS